MVWRLRRLGVVGADDHGEGVFEAEWRFDADVVARGVERADGGEDGGCVALAGRRERLLEDGGERGSGVLDVGVDAAGDEGLLADVAAGEVEAAVDFSVGLAFGCVDGFDLLGEEFAEDDLFGEVFGADDDSGGARRRAGAEERRRQQQRLAARNRVGQATPTPSPHRFCSRSA